MKCEISGFQSIKGNLISANSHLNPNALNMIGCNSADRVQQRRLSIKHEIGRNSLQQRRLSPKK